MTKEEAMEMLELSSHNYSIKDINDKVALLKKVYDPKYKPVSVYETIKYKPNETRYNAIKECAEYLKDLSRKAENEKKINAFIKGTEINKVRDQEPNEKAADYVKYIKSYYEEIIIDQSNNISKMKTDLDNKEVISEQKTDSLVNNEDQIDENVFDGMPEDNDTEEKIDINNLDKNNEDDKLVSDDLIQEALDYSEKGIEDEASNENVETLDNLDIEDNNKRLNEILEKIQLGNEEKDLSKLDKFSSKAIQVTRKFVDNLKSRDYKYSLKKFGEKIVKTPIDYFKQMVEKISNNDETIVKNVDNLTPEELDLLLDEYHNNGIKNVDDSLRSFFAQKEAERDATRGLNKEEAKTIETEKSKEEVTQPVKEELNETDDLFAKVQKEKADLFDKNIKIQNLRKMSDEAKDNEEQRQIYDNLIKEQYSGSTELIKNVRTDEESLNKLSNNEDEKKGNSIGGFLNKIFVDHKEEKIDDSTPEYQLYVEHKNYLNKLKELETKAITVKDDVNAFNAFMQIEEKTPELKQEEDNLMNKGKSL